MSELKLPGHVEEWLQDQKAKGSILNIWTCQGCGNRILCYHADAGVTPFMMTCDECGDTAQSCFYNIKQPTYVWFRPKTTEELMAISKEEYENSNREVKKNVTVNDVYQENLEHFNEGGVFRKAVGK